MWKMRKPPSDRATVSHFLSNPYSNLVSYAPRAQYINQWSPDTLTPRLHTNPPLVSYLGPPRSGGPKILGVFIVFLWGDSQKSDPYTLTPPC